MLIKTLRDAAYDSLNSEEFTYLVVKMMYAEMKEHTPSAFHPTEQCLLNDTLAEIDEVMSSIEADLKSGVDLSNNKVQIKINFVHFLMAKVSCYYD